MNFLEAVGLFSTVVGLFALIDLFPSDARKQKIAEYVFGFHNISYANFETNAVRYLISLVMKEGKLSKKRIFLRLSIPVSAITSVIAVTVLAINDSETTVANIVFVLIMYLMYTIMLAIIGWLWDFWSMFVSYKIFFVGSPSFPWTSLLVLLDATLSLLLPVLGIFLLFGIGMGLDDSVGIENISDGLSPVLLMLIAFQLASFVSVVCLTVIQISTVIGGLILRGVTLGSKANMHIAANSEIYKHPFTFIGIVIGIILATTFAIIS